MQFLMFPYNSITPSNSALERDPVWCPSQSLAEQVSDLSFSNQNQGYLMSLLSKLCVPEVWH